MFYRYANADTLEVITAPNLRTVFNAVKRDRRAALHDGVSCSAATIDAVEGDYITTDPFAPALRTVCAFPAFVDIPGTLYDAGDLTVRGYNLMVRNGIDTNAGLVTAVMEHNAGMRDLRKLRNAGRKTIAEWFAVANMLVAIPCK